MQQLLYSFSRLYDHQQMLRKIEARRPRRIATRKRYDLWKAITSADLHWRQRDWDKAIDLADHVLSERPTDFHALAILATSYHYLGKTELAYPVAKRLIQAEPTSWRLLKLGFRVASFILRAKRAEYARLVQRCDAEAAGDRDILAWARDLVSRVEAPDSEHAV
jgi:tetratricopeptide (TPR) repeat protein